MNPRTPTRPDPESGAFDQAGRSPRGCRVVSRNMKAMRAAGSRADPLHAPPREVGHHGTPVVMLPDLVGKLPDFPNVLISVPSLSGDGRRRGGGLVSVPEVERPEVRPCGSCPAVGRMAPCGCSSREHRVGLGEVPLRDGQVPGSPDPSLVEPGRVRRREPLLPVCRGASSFRHTARRAAKQVCAQPSPPNLRPPEVRLRQPWVRRRLEPRVTSSFRNRGSSRRSRRRGGWTPGRARAARRPGWPGSCAGPVPARGRRVR